MGKKNRRKKGDKKARLEERRERLNEIVDRDDEEDAVDAENDRLVEEPVYIGDRVFYQADIERNLWKRAVVKDAISVKFEQGYSILPLEKKDCPENLLSVPARIVIKDQNEWTLRFEIGDRVLCRSERWQPAVISDFWPIDARHDGIIPKYRCLKDDHDEDGDDSPCLAVPWDNDDYIVRYPQTFRFSVGDDVLVNSQKVEGLSDAEKGRVEQWIPSRVTKVHITGLPAYYAVYECRFKDGTDNEEVPYSQGHRRACRKPYF
jgi:hypothetical protein